MTHTGSSGNQVGPDALTSVITDSGTAIPADNVLNIFGGTNVSTSASGNTVVIAAPGVLPLSGGTMTGDLVLYGNPVNPNDAANKAYVDAVATGAIFKTPAVVATIANLNATYNNGASGVGATLTNAGSQAAFAVDGIAPSINSRVLVKNQTTTYQNGVYSLTTVGSGSTNWVLTRTTDFNTPTNIQPGDVVPVEVGTVNADTSWIETSTVTTVGSSPITFTQFTYNPNTFISTIDGDSGSLTPSSGTVTISGGTTGLTTIGSGSTLDLTGTLVVANGGTGDASFTSYAPIIGGTTTTGALQSASGGQSNSGYVFTSTGSSSAPTFQALSGLAVTSITGTVNQVLANGTTGSAQTGAVTLTLPQSIGTGNSPQFTGLNLSGLTASYAVVTDGSKNLASLQYSYVATGSALVQRDSNGNAIGNNMISGTTNVVSSGGTTTMTVGSSRAQKITGILTQTFTLPDATTLISGWVFEFNNNSTQSITINNKGSSLITTLVAGGYARLICTDNSTSNGVWDYHFDLASNTTSGTAGFIVPSTSYISGGQLLTTGTSSGTISILPQAAAGTYNFNLPTTAGTSGYVLTSAGGGSSPMTWTNLGSAAVTSISATAPITASASTGAVTIALTTPLALNYGGTNANLTASNGGIFYSTSSAAGILSGTSTANQMLQSGASTTPAWSTTTWPATTSINTLLYSSSASVIGQVSAANNGVLISGTTGIPSWLGAGTTGQVLVATTSNPASWGTLSSLAVTSITGTANQIIASASAGAVTLSTPQNIDTAANVQFGTIGLGVIAGTFPMILGSTTTSVTVIKSAVTMTGINALSTVLGTVFQNTAAFVSGSSSSTATALQVSMPMTIASLVNVSSATTLNLIAPTFTGFGIIQNVTTLSVGLPTVGSSTNISAFFAGQVNVGSSTTTTGSLFNVGSSNQTQINSSGQMGIGTAPIATDQLIVGGTISSGTTPYNAINVSATLGVSTGTLTNANEIYISSTFGISGGTITNAASLYIDAGSAIAGTVTNSYGAYILAPTGGTNKTALYTANAAIGSYTGTAPPSNSLIVSGQVGVGASSLTTGSKIDIVASSGGSLSVFRSSDTGANNETLQFRTSYASATNPIIGSIVCAPSNTGGRLLFSTAQNSTGTLTERMRIDDTGLVGIGTSSPSDILSISGPNEILGLYSDASNAPYMGFYRNGTVITQVGITDGGSSSHNFDILNRSSDGLIRMWTNGFNARFILDQNGNAAFFSATGSFGSGTGVIFIANRSGAPSTNPSGGGILYCESGALKYRGSSGTVTTIANA